MKLNNLINDILRVVDNADRSDRAISLEASNSPKLISRLRDGKTPTAQTLIELCKVLDMNLQYEFVDNKKTVIAKFAKTNSNMDIRQREVKVEVTGDCDKKGWTTMQDSMLKARLPAELKGDKDAFAIIVKGDFMQPFNIFEGALLFCSPSRLLELGDIICLERWQDNNQDDFLITIKKIELITDKYIEISGYLPLKKVGNMKCQRVFFEKVKFKNIKRISAVTHIHIKPVI